MPNPLERTLPPIKPWCTGEDWPQYYSEHLPSDTIQTMREMPTSDEQALLERQQQLEVLLPTMPSVNLAQLAIWADQLVDAYFLSVREQTAANRSGGMRTEQPPLRTAQIDVCSKALLNILTHERYHQPTGQFIPQARGASDPIPLLRKTPEDVAFRLVKGRALATKRTADQFTDVGLATKINFPPHLKN